VLLTIFFFAVVCATLYAARFVLLIFVFAILFAYLIDPVVEFLQRHALFFKNLRRPAVVEVYLMFLLLTAFAGHAFAPRLISLNGKIVGTLADMIEDLSTGDIATKFGQKYGWSKDQERVLKVFLARHREDIDNFSRGVEKLTSNALMVIVVVPILAIFFLRDGEHMADAFIQIISTEENHRAIRGIAKDLNAMLKRYIRAKVTLGGCSFTFYSAAMLSLQFPHAIVLGFLGGVLEFIPVAGWMTSAAAIIGAGILTQAHWTWMAVLLGVWRIVMDYFISPRVVGQNLEIHPLMVIFGMMVGGEIGGIVGIYLSIPLMVVIRVIWRRLLHRAETKTQIDSETALQSRDSLGRSLLSSSRQ
jgi:predicted PurR-regulated permease PerM